MGLNFPMQTKQKVVDLQVQVYSEFWLLEFSQNAEMAFFGVVGIMWLSVAGIKYWDEAM